MHYPTDMIVHTIAFVTLVVEHWLLCFRTVNLLWCKVVQEVFKVNTPPVRYLALRLTSSRDVRTERNLEMLITIEPKLFNSFCQGLGTESRKMMVNVSKSAPTDSTSSDWSIVYNTFCPSTREVTEISSHRNSFFQSQSIIDCGGSYHNFEESLCHSESEMPLQAKTA